MRGKRISMCLKIVHIHYVHKTSSGMLASGFGLDHQGISIAKLANRFFSYNEGEIGDQKDTWQARNKHRTTSCRPLDRTMVE